MNVTLWLIFFVALALWTAYKRASIRRNATNHFKKTEVYRSEFQ